jgi:altronate dehydratase small subunit
MSGVPAPPATGRPAHWDALVVHPDDDVAVVLHDVPAGATVAVRHGARIVHAQVTQAIALGHKFALHALAKGAIVRKYGECIGVTTADIGQGSHVHVHNMQSRRARKLP